MSSAEVEQFAVEGFVRVRSAIPAATAADCREFAAAQLGIDLSDPSTWKQPVARGLVLGEPLQAAATAPLPLDAIHQLLDPEEWVPRDNLGLLVVRFPSDADPGDTGWHIDSSFETPDRGWFVNYRSRERGLLVLYLLSDVSMNDAPTRMLRGSHMQMPSLLRPYGDDGIFGLHAPLPEPTDRIAYATGAAGDVYVCHPFLVHAATWPHRGTAPRFIGQPPIALTGALQLDGDEDSLSVVARTVRAALAQT